MASTYTVVSGEDLVAKVKCRNDQVLIKRIKDTKSAGGILLPQNYKSNDVPSERGEIIAVGDCVIRQGIEPLKMDLKPGDSVMFHAFPSGVEIKQEGEEYLMIAERQVVCVLKGK